MVLAAGKGTRMRSRRPKVLHELLGLPLLEYPLRVLEQSGAERVVVVIGSEAEQVRRRFARRTIGENSTVEFALQVPQQGTGDAVRVGLLAMAQWTAAQKGMSQSVVILNGDLPLLSRATIVEMLAAHRAAAAALTLLTVTLDVPAGYGRIIRDAAGEVAGVVEDADATPAERAVREVNGGVYIAEISALHAALTTWIREMPANKQGEIYLPPVIGPMRKQGGKVIAFALPRGRETELQQVNDRVELARATHLRRLEIIEQHQRSGVTVVDPLTTTIEEDVRIGADSVVHPCSVIRAGVEIGVGCEVGPFAHLRSGTVLEEGAEVGNFTEVKNSRLGRGAKAKHLSYLGDGRVGAGANIGAGTIFANYDGKQKAETRVGERAFIGSGTILVAPVSIGDDARTGAGAVVLSGRDVAAGATVVGVPARPVPARAAAVVSQTLDPQTRVGSAPTEGQSEGKLG
ncbi:MAG: bifunctional N-acetylglucosamine-1-phosphate uridyltransferase/glucosamine-1-phosphate acetyltransferase [Planctomycetota bacterium]